MARPSNRARHYRVPGGFDLTWALTWVPTVLLALAAVFFVWNPWDFSFAVTGSILVGVAVTVGFQEYFCWKSPQWTRRSSGVARTPIPCVVSSLTSRTDHERLTHHGSHHRLDPCG
ncbi:hypothetical protein [Actinotalea sp.]|uniref:hypothetical protein n=1 Tax=Actinotalea sp. TaxID=1872145 RepID=UPI00356328D1